MSENVPATSYQLLQISGQRGLAPSVARLTASVLCVNPRWQQCARCVRGTDCYAAPHSRRNISDPRLWRSRIANIETFTSVVDGWAHAEHRKPRRRDFTKDVRNHRRDVVRGRRLGRRLQPRDCFRAACLEPVHSLVRSGDKATSLPNANRAVCTVKSRAFGGPIPKRCSKIAPICADCMHLRVQHRCTLKLHCGAA
jgi:hypothetical protein